MECWEEENKVGMKKGMKDGTSEDWWNPGLALLQVTLAWL